MSGIILKILSIIGMVLLFVLLFLLIFIFLLLFCPFLYRIKGVKNPGKIYGKIRVYWLFGIFYLSYDYPNPGKINIRILGIPLFHVNREKKQRKNKRVQESTTSQKDKNKNQSTLSASDTQEAATVQAENEESLHKIEDLTIPEATTEQEFDSINHTEFSSSKNIFKKPKMLFHKIRYTFYNFYDKIRKIWDNMSYYYELLHEESNLELLKRIKIRIYKILKSIRPKKIKANIQFGTGSPDTTGYIYGLYGMLIAFLGKNVNVLPDFEQKKLEGNIYVSGHITFFTLLWHTIQIIFDKKLRSFIKAIQSRRK